MAAKLLVGYGYQGDAMNLPVEDTDIATPFYIDKLGFSVAEKIAGPTKKVVLERDGIQMAITENGGDPTQDGCAFHVDDVESLRDEFIAAGLNKIGAIDVESHGDDGQFRVFYVVAPDGLCFWFGQKVNSEK